MRRHLFLARLHAPVSIAVVRACRMLCNPSPSSFHSNHVCRPKRVHADESRGIQMLSDMECGDEVLPQPR